jgi:hypothetical protein
MAKGNKKQITFISFGLVAQTHFSSEKLRKPGFKIPGNHEIDSDSVQN